MTTGEVGVGWDVPDQVRDAIEFHWFHVGVGESLELVLLGREPGWYVGHYDRGRMRQCVREGCRLCAAGVGAQLRYVLPCASMASRRVGLMEVGRGVGEEIRDWARSRGGMRGMVVVFERAGRSKHARLDCRPVSGPIPPWTLSLEPPDVTWALRQTWQRIEQITLSEASGKGSGRNGGAHTKVSAG